ncbi:MAG TPA: F0F1 ATP synthase subunit B' [Reyranella sp.]|jgi:F-type H+-transporting ATPase subunit b|nr:F0F1 ATP synthase subunit B' [Reyranella sp.]
MRKPVYGAFAGLAALLASGTAMAKEGSGGMPQLDYHLFAPQLVWLAIAFVALYLVMSRLAVPAIADTLDKRQAKIQGDLDAAEKANEDTRALVAAYEKRLADAREEARRLTRERGEADSAAAAAHFNELHDRLAKQIGEAEKRIAAQRDDVMAGLEHMARDIGQNVYAKLAGQPADQGALAGKVTAAIKGGSR